MLTSPWLHRVSIVAMLVIASLAGYPSVAAAQPVECRLTQAEDSGGNIVTRLVCRDGWESGQARVCEYRDGQRIARVPCYLDGWGWWNGNGCYMAPQDPQPETAHPAWDGHGPEDGIVYRMICLYLEGVDGLPAAELPFLRFQPYGEGLFGDLIDEAIGMLELTGAEMGLAPDPDGAGLIGLPVWMWTEVTPTTWEPDPVSLTALGVTVTVEAAVDHVEWNMGDGRVVTCDQPGTPYQRDFGLARSPDCGYHTGYRQPSRSEPDGRYTITATTHWVITWEFVGTSVEGTVETTRESSASIRINELQVLVGFE